MISSRILKENGKAAGTVNWKHSVSEDVYPQVNLLPLIKQVRIIMTILNCKLCIWIKLEGTVLHSFRGNAATVAVMLIPSARQALALEAVDFYASVCLRV